MRTGSPLPPCIDEQAILSLIEDNPRQAMQLVMNLFNIFLPAITELQTIVNGRIGKENLALDNWLVGDPWVKVDPNLQKPQQAMRVRHARPHHGLDAVGGAGKYVQSLQIDGRGHVSSWAEADSVAAEKAHVGGTWVVVNDAGASTVEFSHANAQATASTNQASGFQFNVINKVSIDNKSHVSAIGTGGFNANEHLSFNGSDLNHDNVASADTAIGTTNYDFNAISKIVLDDKGHVLKVDSTTVGFNAGSALTLTLGGDLNHKFAGTLAITHRVDGGGFVTEVGTDDWGHVTGVA